MKRLPFVALLVALTSSPAFARPYSLGELVARVRSDYPGLVAAREGIEAARAQLGQARRMWLPTGDLVLTLAGTPKIRCLGPAPAPGVPDVENPSQKLREADCVRTNIVDLKTSGTAAPPSLADVAPIHGIQLNLTIQLNQPLFSFGRIEFNIAQAEAQVETAQANLAREEAEVIFNAARAYWGVKSAVAAVSTLNEARDKLKEWIDRIDTQMNGDNPSRYTEGDLARLKIALANIEVLLLDQKRNRDFAEHALQILTADEQAGVDDSELDLADAPVEDLAVWQERALRLRPEIRVSRAAAHGATAVRRLRIAEMLPEIIMTSNFGYGYASNMDTPQNWYLSRPSYLNANFGLQLHQPLDFGIRSGRYLQARHEELQRQAQVTAAIAGYSTELAQAHANWEEARGRAEETGRGERVARGWFNAIDQSSNTGLVADSREMIEAARNYFEFRLRHLSAIFDANLALATLRRAAGEGLTSVQP
ncbi:MAG TPA: TolC family protein [Polyangia bacterium]|nr:TolC family protein [Polyangia bacterium]